jgi:membrane-bound lytic murein transglycosylase B
MLQGKSFMTGYKITLYFFLLLTALWGLPSHADPAFDTWLAAFRQEALAQGISVATLDAALTGVTPAEQVLALDRGQPEFMQTFTDYLTRRVTAGQVARGQALLFTHADLLDAVEREYGVPKAVLVAFWGLESNYGRNAGNLNVPASLVTLAYDGRRSAFFRSQLLDALRIIDAGHVTAADMQGSWAGAMGQMQFMPSTFRSYARDGDGDGRIDLWRSIPDVMYSAAHYLQQAGWQAGEPVALEVRLPADFDWQQARLMLRRPLAAWRAQGVQLVTDNPVDAALPAAIVLPQGWNGPAFMVFNNFDVVMQWNRSISYALSVALLAQQLGGGVGLTLPLHAQTPISIAAIKALQQALNSLDYDAGNADGLIGLRTQAALRQYQIRHGLPADGYPTAMVLETVLRSAAAAGSEAAAQ